MTDWFERLTGFREESYQDTRRRLAVDGRRLRSTVNERSYAIGTLETPSVKELRDAAASLVGGLAGKLSVTNVTGDARLLNRDAANAGALFQVASQFNLLEMIGPDVRPEDGVTRYRGDRTQGPACAIAAGAATIYRNYFAPVDGGLGQTGQRQIDCLRDVGTTLSNDGEALWKMRNGYALCSARGLAAIDRKLADLGAAGVDDVRDRLRIGLHWNFEATESDSPEHLVSQAFCSGLPVSYTNVPLHLWRSFATLVLEGAYEATLWSAVLNAHRNSSPVVYLTRIGGGAFGNDASWIDGALGRALRMVEGVGVDVRIVSRGEPDEGLRRVVREYR
jgi:hypothetical protein